MKNIRLVAFLIAVCACVGLASASPPVEKAVSHISSVSTVNVIVQKGAPPNVLVLAAAMPAQNAGLVSVDPNKAILVPNTDAKNSEPALTPNPSTAIASMVWSTYTPLSACAAETKKPDRATTPASSNFHTNAASG